MKKNFLFFSFFFEEEGKRKISISKIFSNLYFILDSYYYYNLDIYIYFFNRYLIIILLFAILVLKIFF